MMLKLTLVLLLTLKTAFSANILFISPLPSPSHHIWNRALAFGLVNKGHNVTLIGPDKDEKKPVNYHHIFLEGLYEGFGDEVDNIAFSEITPTQSIKIMVDLSYDICQSIFKSKGFQQLLNYPSDFKIDLLILDITLGPCIYPFISRFNYPPTIAVTAFLLPPYTAYNFGNYLFPSYKPWYGLPYNQNMTLIERFYNYIYTYGQVIFRNTIQFSNEYKLAKEAFGEQTPNLHELERHIPLVLSNTDPILDLPQHLSPNIIPVGGLHVREPQKLPQDLQAILNNAKNGVIIFSLGSNVRSDKLDASLQEALFQAFRKLSQTVIWKFESDVKDIPKNVILRKWLPQNDILAHPNVKLFIGHGGALSTQEALAHGVPIICVPFFMDQIINTKNVVDRKLGLSIEWKKIETNYVLNKIKEILNNPIYTKNVQRVSKLFKDRLETPLDRAIFWSEYVMRNKGAEFLNTANRDFPFYKALGLDVLILIVVILLVLLFVISKFVCIVKILFRKNDQKLKKQ